MRHFTAKDLAWYYGMNEKTAQAWAKAKEGNWRQKAYDALQKQMLVDLANDFKADEALVEKARRMKIIK